MQQVISVKQARAITKGRTPLVPVEYETAMRALRECLTFDEAKYWDDKADALAAWAKIYRSNEAEVQAKRLKLHAYRRMGEIAREINPRKTGHGSGPVTLLMQHGMPRQQATAARFLGDITEKQFAKLVSQPKPLAPLTAMNRSQMRDPLWGAIRNSGMTMRAACRAYPAKDCYLGLAPDEIETALRLTQDLAEWLDEFEQFLSKGKKS